jgi:hypothetical protein
MTGQLREAASSLGVSEEGLLQVARYDTTRGISYWRKNYRTIADSGEDIVTGREYTYYDPVYTLPPEGQHWWRSNASWPGPGATGALDQPGSPTESGMISSRLS